MSPETTPHASESSEAARPETAKRELSITVSPAAIEAIKEQIAKRNVPGTSLRVGVKGGGCSGFSYVIQFHDGEPHKRDKIYDLHATDGTPVRVIIDPKSLVYLADATFDFEKTLMRQGFVWRNPQEKAGCGCGTSFSV